MNCPVCDGDLRRQAAGATPRPESRPLCTSCGALLVVGADRVRIATGEEEYQELHGERARAIHGVRAYLRGAR